MSLIGKNIKFKKTYCLNINGIHNETIVFEGTIVDKWQNSGFYMVHMKDEDFKIYMESVKKSDEPYERHVFEVFPYEILDIIDSGALDDILNN